MSHSKYLIALNDVAVDGPGQALAGITIEVPEFSRFAILGSPKSGKTMLVKTLAGLATVTKGSGNILGYALDDPNLTAAVQGKFLQQTPESYSQQTVLEMLQQQIKQYPTKESLSDLLSLAMLYVRSNTRAAALSAGERERLGLILLHIQNPSLLILDDPTAGLDDAESAAVLNLIEYLSEGRTVVFTTSSVTDVARLATHAALLHQGSVLTQGTVDLVLSDPETSKLRVALRGDTSVIYEHIHNLAWIKDIRIDSDGSVSVWTISMIEREATPTRLLRAIMADRSLDVLQFNVLRPPIDQLLFELSHLNKGA